MPSLSSPHRRVCCGAGTNPYKALPPTAKNGDIKNALGKDKKIARVAIALYFLRAGPIKKSLKRRGHIGSAPGQCSRKKRVKCLPLRGS
ncbi:hypothetical protein J6590_022616 [Homalodisca vitripennis]|nr:hypothetical protein J6590_022616 [Homalodisca vitripennis]